MDNLVLPSENNVTREGLAKGLPNQNQKNKAIKKAQEFLHSECVFETNAAWSNSSSVVDAFPVYMDGIDDVCYFECKVQSQGKDAGFILVNINKTDVQFPSYSTEGKTSTEEFSRELGTSTENIQMFRHDWWHMLAEMKTSSGLGDGNIAIEQGFDGTGVFKKGNKINKTLLLKKRQEFKTMVKQAGGVHPRFTRALIDQYYMRDSVVQDSLLKLSKSKIGMAKATYRWTSDELNGTFSCGWHLPAWTQVTNSTGMLSGCGPLALAMMYAYHRQFTGRTKLFNGLDLNSNVYTTEFGWVNGSSTLGSYNQIIKDVAFQIGADCHATYGASATSASMNQLENGGELYCDRLGYNAVLDLDYLGDFAKCKTALSHIRAERPVAVFINAYGTVYESLDGANHLVVAEGVKFAEKKDGISTLWSWWDYEAWYLVNYGWGHKRVWICAEANYGSGAHETTNDGNILMWIN